jgi:hypothetical protein
MPYEDPPTSMYHNGFGSSRDRLHLLFMYCTHERPFCATETLATGHSTASFNSALLHSRLIGSCLPGYSRTASFRGPGIFEGWGHGSLHVRAYHWAGPSWEDWVVKKGGRGRFTLGLIGACRRFIRGGNGEDDGESLQTCHSNPYPIHPISQY